MTDRNNHRPRQHRFTPPTPEEPPTMVLPPPPPKKPRDWQDEEPGMAALWRKATVSERIALILCLIGAAFISWLVARSVP